VIGTKVWGVLACAAVLLGSPVVAAAKVLLVEDFTGATAAGGPGPRWKVQEESPGWMTAAVVDLGGNAVLSLQGSGVAMIGDPAWTDYTVEGDVQVFDASYGAYAAGLLFRADGAGTIYATDGYVYQGRPGEMQLEKWNSGASWQHLVDDFSHAPTPDRWQHFKVQVTGPRIQAWVDGVPTLDHVDTSGGHLHGAVGFRVWGAGAYFDNLVVTEAPPPGVLLAEDFSFGALDPRWTVNDLGLTAQVTTFQERSVLALNGTGMVTIGDLSWRDYTTEADFFVFDGSYWAWQAGILFRASPPLGNWHNTAAYTASGRPYSQQLERFANDNGWWSYLLDTSAPVAAGAWHKVKTVAAGPRFRVFFDGQLAGEVVDPAPYLQGQVGLFNYVAGTYFTNLLVRENDVRPPITVSTVEGAGAQGGWVRAPATVKLDAVDQGLAGVREIRFTVGAAPEAVAAGANAAVSLTQQGPNTLSFHGVDADLNEEAPQTVTVLVDAVAPTVAVAVSPAALVGNGKLQQVMATVSATDAGSGVASVGAVRVTNKDGLLLGTIPSGGTIQLRGAPGQRYLFTAVATDAVGNSASGAATVSVQ
jgi:hypothetical protein